MNITFKILIGVLAFFGVIFLVVQLYIGLFFIFGYSMEEGQVPMKPNKHRFGGRTTPQWTPDGAQIVFSHRGGIYVVDSDGSSLRRIHGSDGENDISDYPNLSPDSAKLVYLKYHCDREWLFWKECDWEIGTSALDGSRDRTLTDMDGDFGDMGSFSWSPDGIRIAFGYRGMIYTIAEDGSDFQPVPSIAGQPHSSDSGTVHERSLPLVWSMDGRRIAFVSRDIDGKPGELGFTMHTVGVDGSDLERFGAVSLPAWSPDGSWMAFTSAALDEEDKGLYLERLYTVGPDGSDPREVIRLPDGLRWGSILAWSPDGSEILVGPFVASVDGSTLRVLPWPDTGADRSSDSNGKPLPHEYSLTSWSPDGSRIAIWTTYYSTHHTVLYTVSRDGSDSKVLVTRDRNGDLSAAGGVPLSEGQTVTHIFPDGQEQ